MAHEQIPVQLSNSFSVTYDNVLRHLTISCQNTRFSTGRVGCLAVQFTLTHDNRYAIGLLTVSPMGDMLRRRGLILFLVSRPTCLTIGLAATKISMF